MDEQADGDHGAHDGRRLRVLRRLLDDHLLTSPCSSISTAANAACLLIFKTEKRWRRRFLAGMETITLHAVPDGDVVPMPLGPKRSKREFAGPQACRVSDG